MDYINFIKTIISKQSTHINMVGGNKKDWIDNFNTLYEKIEQPKYTNTNTNKYVIPLLNKQYLRDMAFDDKMKKKKKGIYREKYEDKNDLDKNKKPKIKFKY